MSLFWFFFTEKKWGLIESEIFIKNSFSILYNVWAVGRLAHCFFGAVLVREKVFGVSGWVSVVCENLWKFVWIFPVKYFVSSANSSTFATAKGKTTLADAPTEPTAEKSFRKKCLKICTVQKMVVTLHRFWLKNKTGLKARLKRSRVSGVRSLKYLRKGRFWQMQMH